MAKSRSFSGTALGGSKKYSANRSYAKSASPTKNGGWKMGKAGASTTGLARRTRAGTLNPPKIASGVTSKH